MRKPITMRFDLDLLSQARLQAARENRTLTNFIETVVRQRMADVSLANDPSGTAATTPSLTPGSAAGQDR
jgi:hypothetical protein